MLRDRDDLLGHREADPPEPGSADRNQEGRDRLDAPGEVGEPFLHQIPSRQGAQIESHDPQYTGSEVIDMPWLRRVQETNAPRDHGGASTSDLFWAMVRP
jgi:hypothetical protein